MSDWQPIETAPKDGTVIEATHNRGRNGQFWPPYKTFWGIGKAHTVEGDLGQALDGYTVNGGRPWCIAEGGEKMAPTPTHWRHLSERES